VSSLSISFCTIYATGHLEIFELLLKTSRLFILMQWGCSGMLLEVLMRNFLLQANLAEKNMESLVSCDLEVNYNNMHKVRGRNRILLSFLSLFW